MSELSHGVQILIEQLKSNPDHFFGPLDNGMRSIAMRSPKFAYVRHAIESELLNVVRPEEVRPKGSVGALWFLTSEERDALVAAFTEARRIRFDADIVTALLTTEDSMEDYQRQAKGPIYVSAGGGGTGAVSSIARGTSV